MFSGRLRERNKCKTYNKIDIVEAEIPFRNGARKKRRNNKLKTIAQVNICCEHKFNYNIDNRTAGAGIRMKKRENLGAKTDGWNGEWLLLWACKRLQLLTLTPFWLLKSVLKHCTAMFICNGKGKHISVDSQLLILVYYVRSTLLWMSIKMDSNPIDANK